MDLSVGKKRRQDYLAAALVFGLILFSFLPAPGTAKEAPIRVLSSRADMVSDGSALVAITPKLSTNNSLRITLNGAEITSSFVARQGDLVGLVRGLRLGKNVLKVSSAGWTRIADTD